MAQAAKAQEPTMEEILASIRRIIADDDAAKPRPAEVSKSAPKQTPVASPSPPPAAESAAMSQADIDAMLAGMEQPQPAPSVDEAPDVFQLTEEMAAPAEPEAPSFHTIDASADIVFTEATPMPPAMPAPAPRSPKPSDAHPAPLISARTSAAVDAAFNSLAHTVLVQNAKTLEDLVKEMLRPMLKSWLDDNLPTLVERLVRAEIERVSRGRG